MKPLSVSSLFSSFRSDRRGPVFRFDLLRNIGLPLNDSGTVLLPFVIKTHYLRGWSEKNLETKVFPLPFWIDP